MILQSALHASIWVSLFLELTGVRVEWKLRMICIYFGSERSIWCQYTSNNLELVMNEAALCEVEDLIFLSTFSYWNNLNKTSLIIWGCSLWGTKGHFSREFSIWRKRQRENGKLLLFFHVYVYTTLHSLDRLSVFVNHLAYVRVLRIVLHVTKTLLHMYILQSRIPRYFFFFLSPSPSLFLSIIVPTLHLMSYIIQFFPMLLTNERWESYMEEKIHRVRRKRMWTCITLKVVLLLDWSYGAVAYWRVI